MPRHPVLTFQPDARAVCHRPVTTSAETSHDSHSRHTAASQRPARQDSTRLPASCLAGNAHPALDIAEYRWRSNHRSPPSGHRAAGLSTGRTSGRSRLIAGYRPRALHRSLRRHRRLTDPRSTQLVWASAVISARQFDPAGCAIPTGKLITRNVMRRHIVTRISGFKFRGAADPRITARGGSG